MAVMAWFLLGQVNVNGFLPSQFTLRPTQLSTRASDNLYGRSRCFMVDGSKEGSSSEKTNGEITSPIGTDFEISEEGEADTDSEITEEGKAATRTVNERLLEELEEVAKKEKFGPRSAIGKKLGLASFKSSKTDEERRAGIEAAKNLNGVNPVTALGGAAFALTAAAGLWALTIFLGRFFSLNPVNSDIYFVQRVAGVVRNAVMGLSSLASGFFGVTGLGIFLLGVRVSYGVMTGELDPTPIKPSAKDEVEVPNVWDLMTQKRGRRGQGKK
jgi:hypothetical protein